MCTMNEFFLINFTVIDSVSLFMNASPHSYPRPKRHMNLYPIYNCSIFGNHLKKIIIWGWTTEENGHEQGWTIPKF